MSKKSEEIEKKYAKKRTLREQELIKLLAAIFQTATKEAANLSMLIPELSGKPFSFADYPITAARVDKLMNRLARSMQSAVVNAINSEWTLANEKNNALCDLLFGDNKNKLTLEQERKYYSNNDEARQAFVERKENGLGLSDRVWKYTNQFKEQIEMALDVGVRNGLSAAEIARELQTWLQQPNKVFHRTRNEQGDLVESEPSKAYHPGTGVAKSSFVNAKRMAANETNMAYLTADHERIQELDFVVGIEVHLSGNHTFKGRDGLYHELHDICDQLQGRYPKDFKFVGWHPNCRCYMTTVLKTREELMNDLLNDTNTESVNTVKDVPQGFKDWVLQNMPIYEKNGKKPPYFVRDNMKYINDILGEKE